MTDTTTARETGHRAQIALDDFVKPAFTEVRAGYLVEMANMAVLPMTADNRIGFEKLAQAIRVLDAVEAQIVALASAGRVAEQAIDRAARMDQMSPEQRRFAKY